ncbi:cation:proton antiporter [Candidatus Epulonipiscium viviparus]|uniref:cation:proton antiporter domain-containing protein n=1 Tax=Candidatus Epulonipiscium viviparus TaxID=420336 RepID=UPI0027380402|nr:cation:proton antiporter [Candidatus Epulopiscium viviparus]
MDFIYLLILSIAVYYAAQYVLKFVKIARPVLYLIVGIAMCVVFNFAGTSMEEIFPNANSYSAYALLLLFLASGFNMNRKKTKKDEANSAMAALGFIPAYFEAILMAFILMVVSKLAAEVLGFEITFFESLLVSSILAMSSPAIIVPTSLNLVSKGYIDKNNIPSQMIGASLMDNFTPFPLIIIALIAAVANKVDIEQMVGMEMNWLIYAAIVGIFIVACILMILFGVVIGRVLVKIFSPLFVKVVSTGSEKIFAIVATTLSLVGVAIIVALYQIPVAGDVFVSFGILIITAVGATIVKEDKTGGTEKLGVFSNWLFAVIGMPVVFINVGANLDFGVIASPSLIIVLLIVIVASVGLKSVATMFVLRGDKYTVGEKKYAIMCFVPKGVTLINFGVAFSGILILADMVYLIDFMMMLAAIITLVTMTAGGTILDKADDRWIFKPEEAIE